MIINWGYFEASAQSPTPAANLAYWGYGQIGVVDTETAVSTRRSNSLMLAMMKMMNR